MTTGLAVQRLWSVVNEKLEMRPHVGQYRAWEAPERFIFIVAGTQGGKTTFGPLWLLREIQDRGPGDYLAITSTFPLLQLKMLPEFLALFQDTLQLGEWHAGQRCFYMHDGTRVIFGSASNPESLESATAKGAWLDECGQAQFRLGSWEAIQRRVALHQGRVLGTTTPYDLGWLKQQVVDRYEAGDPDYKVIRFPSVINPSFPEAEYERARRTLPDWKFKMFYQGEFSRPAGLIYDCFGDSYRESGGHLVHPFNVPNHWPRWVGIDFGAVNTATVWLARDPSTMEAYVYHEQLEGDMTTQQHVAHAKERMAGLKSVTWYGGSKSEKQQRVDWGNYGIRVLPPPVDDVEAGIDRVVQLFKSRKLFVFDTCNGLRDELGSYTRVTDADGEPTEQIRDKHDYHRLDALRYASAGLVTPRPQARAFSSLVRR